VSDGEDISTPELLHQLGAAMEQPYTLWEGLQKTGASVRRIDVVKEE